MALHEHAHRAAPISAGVALLTVSDSRDEHQDRSGALAREMLVEAGHRVIDYRILPDDTQQIRDQIRAWVSREACQVVIVSGGTGISPRDRTSEAVADLLEQRLDGFGELFRALSYEEIGSAAMLSRALGGILSGRPVFALPGSPAAVRLALKRLILPELAHLLSELRKEP